jgi:hypothetical protein
MKSFSFVLAALAAIVFASIGSVDARPMMHHHHHHHHHHHM